MKIEDVRKLAMDELKQRYKDLLKQRFDLKKTKVTSKLENPLEQRIVRRDIARILTVIEERIKLEKNEVRT